MGGIGSWEILLILLFGLIIFGSKRIPEIARGLGKGLSEFKRAARDIQDELSREIERDLNKKESTAKLPPPTTPELTTPGPSSETRDPGADPYPDEGESGADPGVDPYPDEGESGADPYPVEGESEADLPESDSGPAAGERSEEGPSKE